MGRELVPQNNEIILYTTPEGTVRVEVIFQDESFWLNQKKMADLFGVEVDTVIYHLKKVYASGEHKEATPIRKSRIVQPEG
jgi:hypothetical protein